LLGTAERSCSGTARSRVADDDEWLALQMTVAAVLLLWLSIAVIIVLLKLT